MNAILPDVNEHLRQLEGLWCGFHSSWVQASDALAAAEQQLRGNELLPSEEVYVDGLRRQVRMRAEMLEQFEARLRELRNRAAAYRERYA